MKTVFIVFSIDPDRGMRIQDVFSSSEAADQAARTLRGRGLSVGVQPMPLKEAFIGYFEPSKPQSHTAPREFQAGDIVRIVDPQCALRCGEIIRKYSEGFYEITEGNGCTYLYPGHMLTLVEGVEKPAPAQAVLSERAQEKPQHTPETVKLLQETYNFADSAARYMELERHRSRLPMRYEMYLVMNLLDDIKKNVDAILEGRAPDRPPGPQHPPRVPGHNPVA